MGVVELGDKIMINLEDGESITQLVPDVIHDKIKAIVWQMFA